MADSESDYDAQYSAFKDSELREKYSRLYLRFWYREKYLPLLKGVHHDAPILDLGCGSGFMLRCLDQAGFTNVIGIDISASQTTRPKSRGLNVVRTDILKFLRQHRMEFDVILALDVIEHFSKEEIPEVVSGVYESLLPGGLFIIQTPNGEGLLPNYVIYGDLTHKTILSPHSLRHMLMRFGFTEIRMKELEAGTLATFPLLAAWQAVRLTAMLIKFLEIGRVQKYWTESFVCWCRKSAPPSAGHLPDLGL